MYSLVGTSTYGDNTVHFLAMYKWYVYYFQSVNIIPQSILSHIAHTQYMSLTLGRAIETLHNIKRKRYTKVDGYEIPSNVAHI